MDTENPPWTVCEVHTMNTDEDCEYCTAMLDGQQEVLNGMHETIQDLNRKLYSMTQVPYLESATAVSALKADVLVQMLFTDPKARMAYELNFANALTQQMNEVQSALVRQQLTGGVNGAAPTVAEQKIMRNLKG